MASTSSALDAVRLIAEHRLPGLVVTKPDGQLLAILPASQVVRLLVPAYIQDDPSLAGVLGESAADRIAEKLGGKSVEQVLPPSAPHLSAVNVDDTIIEIAAVMARDHSPLVAVMQHRQLVGVITASRLLEVALRVN